jgi:tetratricopeptide (TPR) repeat protein
MRESDSVLTRLWNAIKPPPAVPNRRDAPPLLSPTQKKMLWVSFGVVVLILVAWQGYSYVVSAPLRAEKVYLQGMSNMTPGRYEEAMRLFTKALDIFPQLAVAYLERGNAENILGETEGALSDYDKAIETGNLAAAYTARGRIYMARGDAKRAETDFTQSIGVEPNSDAYFQLGQVLEAAGDHEHAILNFDQAIRIQPDAPFIYRARGMAKRGKGDEAGAAADRDQADALERRGSR